MKKRKKERWRDVVGYEGLYKVSSKGRVKAVSMFITKVVKTCSECGNRYFRDKQVTRYNYLKLSANDKGYSHVKLYKGGKGKFKSKSAHRLVLEAFVGPCPEGLQCRHLDGNPSNNKLSNLKWGTRKKNMADREKHGRHDKGSNSVKAKLTEADIPIIRKRLKDANYRRGILTAIAKDYKVDAATIRDIRDGLTWKHVD